LVSAADQKKFITWRSLIGFGGLAGLGWIGDFCLLMLLVGLVGLESARANAISSVTAALAVFLMSRELVFLKARGRVLLRCTLYLGYTAVVILLASVAIRHFSAGLEAWLKSGDRALPSMLGAGIAKVLVTPPQFLLNYFMSRWLSESKL
jgi:putative flippase GtrA